MDVGKLNQPCSICFKMDILKSVSTLKCMSLVIACHCLILVMTTLIQCVGCFVFYLQRYILFISPWGIAKGVIGLLSNENRCLDYSSTLSHSICKFTLVFRMHQSCLPLLCLIPAYNAIMVN